jgi:predicted component of type VI protein secretion system
VEDLPVSLTVVNGPNPGQEYELESDEITIGRSGNNVIVLPLPEISRRHARILRDGEAFYIEDLGSTNGTFVNHKRLQAPVRLNVGDEVQVGDTLVMRFASSGEAAVPLAMPAESAADASQAAEPDMISDAADDLEELEAGLPPSSNLDLAGTQFEQWLATDPRRVYYVGLGGLFLLLVACFSLVFFLDAYQEGRLLYCGSLRSFFELFLGPVGFNPVCP